ncbi:MAG: hypothetical protein UW27_C0004G0065 [Parcubacteria group bacterium GW2011_GWA1_44_13]|uniref:Uncharacterized protein n=1 Tax=Candidatus Nomurabacteria bacterium GW2011_GWB1_44_12 TaxID=1618748 RepID=A0A837IHI6_9BACT|nr:MAG: hypothetical protein UW17_C0001G0018 [Candidatus Nomurabacteria bacterium GW2011_GWD1_44_10]KKT36584.1 MAG: hypothetical protein UW25_C0005G0066 [Candidatus Nomurabacteria bacterium GW2011_GWB1_44_12]KKT38210.1 MAG: hypothetical protein UW27_C0004G0065 [Parcubacteria group bacterium GW2011_GWA1_44_13]KKT60705.1 MAG: hypothetical protein UW54_C0005G0009 [Parcubacteria group bacterium GW2011_GWC1_44_26]HBB44232.1 hypothetical protein [Candidatus Yonathbacteria bacterium]
MGDIDDVMWSKVAHAVLYFFTTVLGALLFLNLAVFFKFEFVSAWTYFAMFFGALLWFIVVATLLWEWKTNGRKHRQPYQFLAVEAVCTAALLVSASGLLFEAMKSYAIVVDTLITLAFFAIFARFSLEKRSVR